MSKHKSKVKKQTQRDEIYDLYRSCRLCGAGAGYKMPIVQNIIPVEDTEVELKTKIQECLQIEVHEADRMPPLICELCADKISDFYEFLVMCKHTNNCTRTKLGLGPMPEIIKNIDMSDRKLAKIGLKESRKKGSNEKGSMKKVKIMERLKKEFKQENDKIKKETRAERELRDLIASNPVLSSSQRSRSSKTRENMQSLKYLRMRPGQASSKLKSVREIVSPEVASKKMKVDEALTKHLSIVKVTNSVTNAIQTCDICKNQFPRGTSFRNHYRKHKKVETSAPKPRETHQSDVEDPIVGNCRKCGKAFEVYSTFKKHQAACRGGKVRKALALRRDMKPVQVRMTRCDSLLRLHNGHYDVSDVRCPYGLDRSCIYPYSRHQSLLHTNRMVEIKLPEIPDGFDIDDDTQIVHWDSDDQSDTDSPRQIESLSSLCLRVIFSEKFLGKVPKRRKKIAAFENEFGLRIDRIISNLDMQETKEPKHILDNVKDNWSDNVSDSILRNDRDSDTFSIIGDFNDDSNNDIHDKANEIDVATQDGRRTSPMVDFGRLLKGNSETTDGPTDDFNESDEMIYNKISAVKSGIELIEIEIINDNDVEVFKSKQNAENNDKREDRIVSTSPMNIESIPLTERSDRVDEKENNEESHVNTDTNDEGILDNTVNNDVRFHMEDLSKRTDLAYDIDSNDFYRERVNEVNTEAEIIIQNCFSLSNHFNIDGKPSPNNAMENSANAKIDHNSKTESCERKNLDENDVGIYDGIINNIK